MTLEEKRQNLVAQLSAIKDTQERIAFVVDYGRRQPALARNLKSERYRVEGCLAGLWLVPGWRDGKWFFQADSDSAIMKGIAAMLCEFYSGQTPEEIAATDPSFLGQVGITQHLTPNRRNGLSRIWERMRDYAFSKPTQEADTPDLE